MSTLALDGSRTSPFPGGRPPAAARYLDLLALAVALPIFLLAGLPVLGYAVVAAAWIVARALGVVAERRAARELAAGDRRAALGTVAVATLGRVWLIALAVLLVGVLADRDDGLAGALLALALFTLYMGVQVVTRLLGGRETPS